MEVPLEHIIARQSHFFWSDESIYYALGKNQWPQNFMITIYLRISLCLYHHQATHTDSNYHIHLLNLRSDILLQLYIVVCDCSQRVQLEKGGKKCNHILSRNSFWRLHILANRKNPSHLKLYQSSKKISTETRVHEIMNNPSKRIQTHCGPTALRVQKIKWAEHRHFRTFLAITVKEFLVLLMFLAKIRIW